MDEKKPPVFMKPGDNPEFDRQLAELRQQSEYGDPFYYKVRGARRRAAVSATGGSGAANLRVGSLAAAVGDTTAKISRRIVEPRWLKWIALAIMAPIAALLIGAKMRERPVVIQMAPASPASLTSPTSKAAPPAPSVGAAKAMKPLAAEPKKDAAAERDAASAEELSGSTGARPLRRPLPRASSRNEPSADEAQRRPKPVIIE